MAKKRKQAVKRQARSTSGTPELVTWALQGIQQAIDETRAKLADLEAQARKLRGASRGAAAAPEADGAEAAPAARATRKATRGRKKRTLSADARRRIAEAQKRRWAKVKKEKSASTS